MKNYYSRNDSIAKKFQETLAKKLLEAELKLLEKEKEAILKEVITANDRINADNKLFNIELEMRKKKESYVRNMIYIHQQDNDLYNNQNIYNNF